MKGLIEYKTMTAEVKDVDTATGTVTGFWSKYGNKDHDRDIIVEHAARKTIQERGPMGTNEIFFLNQHNWAQPHGKPSILESQDYGIYFESKVALTSYGKDAIILYEAGIVIQHSIGFQTIQDEAKGSWSDDSYVRYIKEIKLYEGSNVTLGANPETPFTGFKSLTLKDVNCQVDIIVKLLRNGTLTDDTFSQLEIALKQLQKQSYELGQQNPLTKEQPDKSTDLPVEPDMDKVGKSILNIFETAQWKKN